MPGQTYTVALHFAELYFSDKGERIFTVQINGITVLQDFDIVKAAGEDSLQRHPAHDRACKCMNMQCVLCLCERGIQSCEPGDS